MIRLSKSVISFGAVALVACVATLAVPRAAAAVAAKLVQVTNTAANPAITQSARNLASQLVQLTSSPPPQGVTTFVNAFSNQNVAYYVPAGQSLVVTAVDITPPPGCTSQPSPFELIDSGGLSNLNWTLPPLEHRPLRMSLRDRLRSRQPAGNSFRCRHLHQWCRSTGEPVRLPDL
jgi:hypothetical protein